MSLADNIDFLRHLPKLPGLQPLGGMTAGPSAPTPLQETADFGSNPGDLRMFSYVPASASPRPALVVVLHGCTQTAAAYDYGTGWSAVADRYGFAVLMPEQKKSNNPNTCFNWFNADDIGRDSGETLSIRQMIEQMAVTHRINRKRIFVTGLSAGGAMSSVMLATYPDVFAAGAIIAGLPYGVATSMQEALTAMYRAPVRSGEELGNLVRKATAHAGPWPRVSVWHGSADRTVNPANGAAIVQQWCDLHGFDATPMASGDVDGYPRDVWWNADGDSVVESYTITGMAHGTPLAVGGDESYGAAGKFLLEAGIPSTLHIAQFFGLTGQAKPRQLADAQREQAVTASPPKVRSERPAARPLPGRRALDIGAVINRALSATGLIK